MSPFKQKFTAEPNLDSEGFDMNGLFIRGIVDEPDQRPDEHMLNPPGWREVDGVALPLITWAEEISDTSVEVKKAVAEYFLTGRKVADFTFMSDAELDQEHKEWVERKPWTDAERAEKLLGTLFHDAKDAK